MTTGNQIIQRAGRLIGAIDPGETLTASEAADGLISLNGMLNSWANRGFTVYAQTRESLTLTPATGTYTIGTGGALNTARPLLIINAFIRSGGYDYPVEVIGQREYDAILDKDLSRRPEKLFYLPAYPLASVYLYPVPDAADALHLISRKAVDAITLTGDMDYPAGYDEAIAYNLAVRLAPEYGLPVPAAVAAIAVETLDGCINLNLANSIQEANVNPMGPVRPTLTILNG